MKYLLAIIVFTYAATTAVAVHSCQEHRGRSCEAVSLLMSTSGMIFILVIVALFFVALWADARNK